MHSLTSVSLSVANYLVYCCTQPIQVVVPWDADLFAKATVAHCILAGSALSPASMDSGLMSKFPTQNLGPFKTPTTLVDCHGRILIWYLPGILDSAGNVCHSIWTQI